VGLSLGRSIGSVIVAIAAALAVIGAAILVFLNPVWVGFEQIRTKADLFTGYTVDDVHRVTNAVLGELIFGPATFLQQVGGVDVFDPRERQHLVDVRSVLVQFLAVILAGIVILVIAGWRARDREWLWRSVAAGTAVLAGAVVVVGAVFAIAFDQAFDFFHRLFFAGGSYTFDPREERLVQLFPEDFWSETSIALALAILVLAVAVTWFALRRATVRTTSAASQPVASREGVA